MTRSLFDEKTFYLAFIKDLAVCREEIIVEKPLYYK